jgi:NADPH:quinone reductase-like Zn-dependent oxidoreductase
VVLGLLGGGKAELDLALVLGKRARILGMVMRSRGVGERIALTERFRREHWPLFESGRLAPKLDSVYALEDVRLAHERMEQNLNTGKIVLRVVPNTGSMTTSELP